MRNGPAIRDARGDGQVRDDEHDLLTFACAKRSCWRRRTNLARDPRIAAVVNAGVEYGELRGVDLSGAVAPAGDVPRAAAPDRAFVSSEQLFARRHSGGASSSPTAVTRGSG